MLTLVNIELKQRYGNSLIGILWTIMNPFIQSVVLFFVFREIFKVHSVNGTDFFAYVYSGTLIFNLFSQSILQSLDIFLSKNKSIESSNTPAEIYIISSTLGNLLNCYCSLLPFFLYIYLSSHKVTLGFLLAFITPIMLLPLAIAISLIFATLRVRFSDLNHLIPIAFLLLFYLTPVFYSEEMLSGFTRTIVVFNPIARAITEFRAQLGLIESSLFMYIPNIFFFGVLLMFVGLRFVESRRKEIYFPI